MSGFHRGGFSEVFSSRKQTMKRTTALFFPTEPSSTFMLSDIPS